MTLYACSIIESAELELHEQLELLDGEGSRDMLLLLLLKLLELLELPHAAVINVRSSFPQTPIGGESALKGIDTALLKPLYVLGARTHLPTSLSS